MSYQAETLKNILFAQWSLTGRLAKDGTTNTPRPVFFFSREQLEEKIESKAIEVIKSTPLVTQRNTEFYTNETDEFLIRIIYKLQGTTRADWDISESDTELMETEIETILKTVFNPQTATGLFFASDLTWSDNDKINQPDQDPYIVRELRLSLTRIISRNNKTFNTFDRGVFFDLSESLNMDNPPTTDRDFVEVFDITGTQGHRIRELDVTSNLDGVGIPLFYAGRFSGLIIMKSYFTEDDIGNDASKINQIYKRQQNGELIEAAIVQTYSNTNSKLYTETTLCLVTEIRKPSPMSTLKTWEITAKILKPTIETIA